MVAEGSYPYIIGGVGTWMESLLTNLPHHNFQVANLGSFDATPSYKIPPHVTILKSIGLSHRFQKRPWFPPRHQDSPPTAEAIELFIQAPTPQSPSQVERVLQYALKHTEHGYKDWVFSKPFISSLLSAAEKHPKTRLTDLSFTIREHLSYVFTLAREVKRLKNLKVIHSTTSGLAGLFSLLASMHHTTPLLLTEHADYVSEKKFYEERSMPPDKGNTVSALTTPALTLKLNFFRNLRSALYKKCYAVTSLFEGYRTTQVKRGTQPQKCHVIPNGIKLPTVTQVHKRNNKSHTIGYLGRLSPEKSIKTIIKTFELFHRAYPDAKCVVAGPSTDLTYASECKELSHDLGLQGHMSFVEHTTPEDFFPNIDTLLLASTSEGQPYAILEAMARDVPVVCTNVGDCKRMLAFEEDGVKLNAGIAVDEHTPESLCKALFKFYKTANTTQHPGAKIIAKNFALAQTLDGFDFLYNQSQGA